MGDQWEQGRKGYIGGPMRWGTNEFKQYGGGPVGEKGPMRGGTNEMGGPMSRREGGNERGDQWNGWCVGANWRTNDIGDQWDGGPYGLAEIGWINEKGANFFSVENDTYTWILF